MNTFIQHAANAVAALVTGEGFVASLVESGVVTDGEAYVQAVNDFVAQQVKTFEETEEAEEEAKPVAKPAAKPKAKAEAKPAAKPKAVAAKPKAEAKPAAKPKAKAEAAKPAPAGPSGETKVYIVNNAVAKKHTLLVPEGLDLSDAMTCVDNAKLVKVVSAKCQGYHFAAAHLKAVKEALDTLGYVVVETNVDGFLSASTAKPAAKPKATAAKPKAVAKPVEEEDTVEDPAGGDEGDVDEDDAEEDFAPAEDAEEDEDEEGEAVESEVEEDEGEAPEDAEGEEEEEEGEEAEEEEGEEADLNLEADDNETLVGEVGGKAYAWVELEDEATCVGRMDAKATTKVEGFVGCVPLTAADKKILDGYRVLTKEDAKHFTAAQVKSLKAGKFL